MEMLAKQPGDTFAMANLPGERTGLPFVVWISCGGDANRNPHVCVSRTPAADPSEMIVVAIQPYLHVVAGEMDASDLALLSRWVQLNRQVLVRHWTGDIEFSEDAINALTRLDTNSTSGG